MADISRRITRKSLKAKRKAAIKTIKAQTREKIRLVKMECSIDAEHKKARSIEKEQKKELKAQKLNARISYNARQPRPYTLGEDLFNSICHGIGAGLGVAAIVLLVMRSVMNAPAQLRFPWVLAYSVFGSLFFLVYLMSTLSHAITASGGRKVFSILTNCSFYLLIASTFTPFALKTYSGSTLSLFLVSMWAVSGLLIVLQAVFSRKLRGFTEFTYVVMGLGLTVVFAGFGNLLVAGSALYLIGGCCALKRSYKWSHSVFHLFMLAGTVFHFFAIFLLLA